MVITRNKKLITNDEIGFKKLPFDYIVVRTKRKTLSVCVDRRGQVVVRAPLKLSDVRIVAFLHEKREWIERRVVEAKGTTDEIQTITDVTDGAVIPLFGEKITIRLFKNTSKNNKAFLVDSSLYICDDCPTKNLLFFLRQTAREYIAKRVAETAKIMEATYTSISINGAKTRWGSCSYNNRLNFSYRVIYLTQQTINYVVIHELAHTFEKNHSRSFWKIVEKYEPQYKEIRADLKKHGYYMEVF